MNINLAHVRDIEEPRVRARSQMLFDSARWVLNGHVPAAEINHPAAHPAVRGIQGRLFQSGRLL
jgi:hypothetical protein